MKNHRLTLGWAGLLAIDLVSRARYLAPRLVTVRGATNYVVAAFALWLVVRLLATVLRTGLRLALFAIVVALPMATEWGMFRSYGQFVETTDFLTVWTAPRVAMTATGGGADLRGVLLVFLLALACAALVPFRPLRRRNIAVAATTLVAVIVTGATWWRASPSLEHSQPAFCCALAGIARKASTHGRTARHGAIAAQATTGPRPNIVLVIGESLAASHLSLYGYERDTTPNLRALEAAGALVTFEDAVVMGPHTRTSVPYIMTGLEGPDPNGRVFGAPNVFEYAKARGYHTAFVSAQDESWGDLDAILRPGTDVFETGLQFAPEVDVLKGSDDLVVLRDGALPVLARLEEPFLLVLHMDGSHVPYARHSPPGYKVWDESEGWNSLAAYDNTIRVTDDYLAQVHAALVKKDPRAWMFFTSDHGQALGEGGAFYHRGYQSNVVRDPLFVFPPEQLEQWRAIAKRPVSACDLAPTLLHLMGTAPDAPMDCHDLLKDTPPHARVVSAYTPAFHAEPTMLVLLPDGRRELYDLDRGTVILDDGVVRPIAEAPPPSSIEARLVVQ